LASSSRARARGPWRTEQLNAPLSNGAGGGSLYRPCLISSYGYAQIDPAQQAVVEAMYTQILRALLAS